MLKLPRLSPHISSYFYKHGHVLPRYFGAKGSFLEVTDESFKKEVLDEKDRAVIVDFYAK
jgi:hypothetical protein